MAATKKTELIEIKPIQKAEFKVRIVGDTPLIVHAWSAKAKREILWKELGFPKIKAREAKNPFEDFCSSMYWLTPMPDEMNEETVTEAVKTAKFGIPLTGLKQAALSAAYRQAWVKDKMSLRGAFFIKPDHDFYYGGDLRIDHDHKRIEIVPNQIRYEPMLEIHSDPPIMREDPVKVGMGAADLRYRGEFRNWYVDATIQFNENGQYSKTEVVNFLNAGGFCCGIGEWRPERDGNFGMFSVIGSPD